MGTTSETKSSGFVVFSEVLSRSTFSEPSIKKCAKTCKRIRRPHYSRTALQLMNEINCAGHDIAGTLAWCLGKFKTR